MIDNRYLADLLPILKLHGVKHVKMQGLELEFHVEQGPKLSIFQEPSTDQSTEIIADTLMKQEQALPPDLRADNLMNQDTILNWSSPDQSVDEPPLPLTGEQPL